MQENISKDMLKKWLKAWCLSRDLPLPTTYRSGFKVEVGYEKQKARYVFPGLNEDLIALANSITEPWVFLKVCAAPAAFKELLPARWIIQPQGYIMTHAQRMKERPVLDVQYRVETEENGSVYQVKIIADSGELAASGRLILVDELAVYDRIATDVKHRRKGLAAFVMKTLEGIALSKGTYNNFLVATEEGKLLYSALGWEVFSLYTSAVIPAE